MSAMYKAYLAKTPKEKVLDVVGCRTWATTLPLALMFSLLYTIFHLVAVGTSRWDFISYDDRNLKNLNDYCHESIDESVSILWEADARKEAKVCAKRRGVIMADERAGLWRTCFAATDPSWDSVLRRCGKPLDANKCTYYFAARDDDRCCVNCTENLSAREKFSVKGTMRSAAATGIVSVAVLFLAWITLAYALSSPQPSILLLTGFAFLIAGIFLAMSLAIEHFKVDSLMKSNHESVTYVPRSLNEKRIIKTGSSLIFGWIAVVMSLIVLFLWIQLRRSRSHTKPQTEVALDAEAGDSIKTMASDLMSRTTDQKNLKSASNTTTPSNNPIHYTSNGQLINQMSNGYNKAHEASSVNGHIPRETTPPLYSEDFGSYHSTTASETMTDLNAKLMALSNQTTPRSNISIKKDPTNSTRPANNVHFMPTPDQIKLQKHQFPQSRQQLTNFIQGSDLRRRAPNGMVVTSHDELAQQDNVDPSRSSYVPSPAHTDPDYGAKYVDQYIPKKADRKKKQRNEGSDDKKQVKQQILNPANVSQSPNGAQGLPDWRGVHTIPNHNRATVHPLRVPSKEGSVIMVKTNHNIPPIPRSTSSER